MLEELPITRRQATPESSAFAVVLLQMGGPANLAQVEPFLANLFSDPDLVQLPLGRFYQKFLAQKIAARRAPKVSRKYAEMGGGSPVHRETIAQVQALAAALPRTISVRHVFRYCEPRAQTVLQELRTLGISRVVALPMYPQRSRATTGSALRDLEGEAQILRMTVRAVTEYPTEPGFIRALADLLRQGLQPWASSAASTHVLFVAHGLPMSYTRRGDPYIDQVHATLQALRNAYPGLPPSSLAYQGQVGPMKWHGPSVREAVANCARNNCGVLCVVPVSFTCEHLETLHELDLEAKELARQAGIPNFERIPTVACHPSFIASLARLTLKAAGDWVGEKPCTM